MKKSKFIAAALATTMFATAACGLVACDKDASGLGTQNPVTPEPPAGKVVTVTFNAGTGTLSGSATLKTNTSGIVQGTVPTATPADTTNYTFEGWTLTQNGTTVINFKTKAFTENTPVYAVYKSKQTENPPTPTGVYTITLNAGTNGSCDTVSLETTDGKLTALPDATANSGYKFDGWFTAASGGNKVELNNIYNSFTANGTIYAQYTYIGGQQEDPESDGELLVGGQTKLYLTDNTENIVAPVEGNTATYEYMATGVELDAGDVVSFKIKGNVLVDHATPAEGPRLWDTDTRHGVTFNQAAGTFTVKSSSSGVFSIYVRYYDTGTDAAHPCWSIEFTDGEVDSLVPGGLYLVGSGFEGAGWAPSTDLYIDPDEGLVITLKQGDSFKTCHSDSSGTGALWDMGDNTKYKEVNGTYLNFSTLDSGMGNAGVTSGTHTYRITFEDGMVVFTCLD